jgi:putative redox protein
MALPRPQAVVAGDLDDLGALIGRPGASEFSIGGPDGRGGTASGERQAMTTT